MRRLKFKSRQFRQERRSLEVQEIDLLEKWIEYGKPDPGSNPLSFPLLQKESPVGQMNENEFSRYAGCELFRQLPLSKKTRDGLKGSSYIKMTDIQRASLPHSLCGRDILGAAKTGSGKTLAFVIPILEKLHRLRWGPEDGVGSIIISPTRELASQLFDVLNSVGKFHGFSAGLLIGGRKGVDTEKERVNELNIVVCTPGRLLQHMDETPNFECSELQVLVLDEADRILDIGFKKALNSIVSQLPKQRQTLLFSATQTKSVQDLARLSLKDPEYLSVHEEAITATPQKLQETAMVVPLDQKLDLLWSFIKAHLTSTILVFLTSRKQVKFVFEAFKKLHPGIPLKCLHGKMNQEKRLATYSQFCGTRAVLFSTDVSSRGLDFDKAVDWVVQVDCPADVATYIHRVGRTARYDTAGRSILFLEPSEVKILEKLKAAKIPIKSTKVNENRLQPVSALLASLLVKFPDMQHLARRAFITYLKAIHKEKDKEIFDVMKLPIEEFSASLGLPMTPKLRPATRVLKKKKKLKINVHRPVGTRVVFDEDGHALPPLATLADRNNGDSSPRIDVDKVQGRYEMMRQKLEEEDQEDKLQARQLRKEKRMKKKMKWQRERLEEEEDDELLGSFGDEEDATAAGRSSKKQKTRGSGSQVVELHALLTFGDCDTQLLQSISLAHLCFRGTCSSEIDLEVCGDASSLAS
ncbi:hypothetical protein Nepgr_021993 [Nepenthes gracilis]|uniref:ATP-dependent RNA helicase n=1 Tax=Nepenthes gracilis TaxID=150966 RepID=A0AAD3T023_NEPGR|nr:hypothetical protein Nepgr_021993 [Nepenthes gracilis]